MARLVGSNPIGSTILLNHVQPSSRLRQGICAVVCAITTGQTPASECIQGLALCVHADVRVVRQHLRRDVPDDFADDAVVGL